MISERNACNVCHTYIYWCIFKLIIKCSVIAIDKQLNHVYSLLSNFGGHLILLFATLYLAAVFIVETSTF